MLANKYKNFFVAAGIVLISVLIVLRVKNIKDKKFENISTIISYPIVVTATKISNAAKKLFSKSASMIELENQVEKLSHQNEKLIAENIKLNALSEYSSSSNEIRKFKDRYNLEDAIVAKIALKHINEETQYILINQGSQSGIEQNMIAVYNYQIIGRVLEVYSYHSKILLITDSKSNVSGYTSNSKAHGIVQGKNIINRCMLAYVSHLFKIEPDELVISSGQGLIFPQGFCLGKIISAKKQNVCYEIEIEPTIDLQKLEFCLLLPKSNSNMS